MIKEVFFQSSLPRSGSTLFQNIMGQNPNFYVTPTSGVLELLYGARVNFSELAEFKAQDQDVMKVGFLAFCREGMVSFYNEITDKSYILDKSRGWAIHYNFLNEFYQNPKIIVVIRDLRDILASMENIFRKNSLSHDKIVNNSQLLNTTVEKRLNYWLNTAPIGLAVDRLGDIIDRGIADKVHFIKYEALVNDFENQMSEVYKFLGVEYYEHDKNNIPQITQEDDIVYGIYGNHTIKPSIEDSQIKKYKLIIGDKLGNAIYNKFEWFFNYFNYKK